MQLPDVHDEQHYPPSDFTTFPRRDIQRACLRTWQGLSQLRPVQPCWQGDRQHDHHHYSNMVIILIKMIRVREAGGRVEQSANWQNNLTTWEKARSGNHHFDHDHHMQIQIGWWWSSWWQRQSSTKDMACSMMLATIIKVDDWTIEFDNIISINHGAPKIQWWDPKMILMLNCLIITLEPNSGIWRVFTWVKAKTKEAAARESTNANWTLFSPFWLSRSYLFEFNFEKHLHRFVGNALWAQWWNTLPSTDTGDRFQRKFEIFLKIDMNYQPFFLSEQILDKLDFFYKFYTRGSPS